MLLNPKYLKCDRSTCDPHKNGDESPFPSYQVFNPPGRPTAAHTPQPGLAAKVTPSAAPRASPHRPPPTHTRPPPLHPIFLLQAQAGPHSSTWQLSGAEHAAGWSARDFKATYSKAKGTDSQCPPGLPPDAQPCHLQKCGGLQGLRGLGLHAAQLGPRL